MDYELKKNKFEEEEDDGGEGSGTSSLLPDLFSIPDPADPTELTRITEKTITAGHSENTAARIGQRQPDVRHEGTGPGVSFEEQPKLANQHDGVPPNISNNPADNPQIMDELEKRAENSEVSPQLLQQLNPEKRAELANKAANTKKFNPTLTR